MPITHPTTPDGSFSDAGRAAWTAEHTLPTAAEITVTQSGNGASTRTVQAKTREIISVKDFGATGNGSSDDSAAIQAAIDAVKASGGGTIWFPEADSGYLINTGLSISLTADTDVSITFAGMSDRSRLVAGGAIAMLTITNTTANVRRITIKDMMFNLATVATAGVVLNNASYHRIIDSHFVNGDNADGIRLTATCRGIIISRNYFLHGEVAGTGVSIQGTSLANIVSSNYFGEGIDFGVELTSGTMENIIADNVFYSIGDVALDLTGSDRNVIRGNLIREVTNHGIRITSCNRNQILDNIIRDYGSAANQQNGIFINTASSTEANDNVIRGNTFLDADATGDSSHVRIAQSSGNSTRTLVENNDFDSSFTVAAVQDAGTSTRIRNNRGYVSENWGVTSVADGGTIAHGLAAEPTSARATASTTGEFVSITAKSSTTLTVAIKKHDNSAGTTQNIYWEANL